MTVRQAVQYGLPYVQAVSLIKQIERFRNKQIGNCHVLWYSDDDKEGHRLLNVLIGLAAFIGGALVSWVNFLLLRMLIKNRGNTGIGLISPIRTILSIVYLVILYWIGKHTELNLTALLIGGALGLTVMLTFFTLRLTKEESGKGKG